METNGGCWTLRHYELIDSIATLISWILFMYKQESRGFFQRLLKNMPSPNLPVRPWKVTKIPIGKPDRLPTIDFQGLCYEKNSADCIAMPFFWEKKQHLGRGFKDFCNFHPDPWGRWTHFDLRIFSDGLVQPPTRSFFQTVSLWFQFDVINDFDIFNPLFNGWDVRE